MLLEEGLEQVTSRRHEAHPLFQQTRRRLSKWLVFTNLLQWICFLVAAFVVPDAPSAYVLPMIFVCWLATGKPPSFCRLGRSHTIPCPTLH